MRCPICNGSVKKKRDIIKEDEIEYEYYKCIKCGEQFLDMSQLKIVAEKYKALRHAREITFKKWGNSIAVRIPKEFTDELGIKPKSSGLLMKEKEGLRIVLKSK